MAGTKDLQLIDAFTPERVLGRFAIGSEVRFGGPYRPAAIEGERQSRKFGRRRCRAECRRRAVVVG